MAQTTVTTPSIVGPNLGSDFGPQFGHAMAAGDFDGDGKREVAVSTYEEENASYPDNAERGHVYVYEYDSGWSSGIEVPYPGGSETEVFFGYAMTAGDVDGDGKDELVVAAPGGEGAGALENGAVYIFDYDDSGTPTFLLKHKFRSDPGNGGQQGDSFGWSVALGDYNGDGDLDLLVGARYWSECETCVYDSQCNALEDWTGAAYVFDHDGFESSSSWREVSEASLAIHGEASWSPDINPTAEQTRGYFGARVAFLGDVNDDGYDDFIVTASRRTPDDFATCTTTFDWYNYGQPCVYQDTIILHNDCRVGKVYLFAGSSTWPGAVLEASSAAKVIFEGEDSGDKFGQGLASQGDLNGDGVNDIVISSILHTETSQPNVGRVYVFLLPDYSNGWPSSNDKVWPASSANIIIDGPTNDSTVHFGYAMACDGNTNKETDSRADLIVGAPRGKSCDFAQDPLEENRGFAYLFRYTTTPSMTHGMNGGHEIRAANTDKVAYYQILCHNDYRKYAPQLGRSAVFIGDADGATGNNDEFVIGCPGWDTTTYPSSADDRGGVYMIAH